MANKKRKVVTSKAANNNNNGRANSSWGLVQTLADKTLSRQACVYSANGRACPLTDCPYEHGQQLGSPPPLLPLSRSRGSNNSSRSVTTECLPPPQAPGRRRWRVLATTKQTVGRRTLGGGRGGGRGSGNGTDVMLGVRDDGIGPAAQRGRPGGIVKWEPLQFSRIHACRWRRTACSNLVRYRRISFLVRAP